MNYFSTNNPHHIVSFEEAVMQGIAPDGGLFMPSEIPVFTEEQLYQLRDKSFKEIAFQVLHPFLKNEIGEDSLRGIIEDVYTFDAPLKFLADNLGVLELFHGPTLAFKDFGARFMARIMGYFNHKYSSELTILVATSGDTGSAVANGFYKQPGVQVVLLYPSRMVSEIQEKQLTTMGENIIALEVEGTFDDCQRLVKHAFLDAELKESIRLSSANSINIARLLPQVVYYVYAFTQLPDKNKEIVFSVPSGNLGNLTAGLLAAEMGIPVKQFVAALNRNNVFQSFLASGELKPVKAVPTISNAMDVGNPSNLARIRALYHDDLKIIKKKVHAYSFDDDQTLLAIRNIFDRYHYVMDPHGAVGFLGIQQEMQLSDPGDTYHVVLETAHPAKFKRNVENVLDMELPMPEILEKSMALEKKSVRISNQFNEFKEFLINCVAVI